MQNNRIAVGLALMFMVSVLLAGPSLLGAPTQATGGARSQAPLAVPTLASPAAPTATTASNVHPLSGFPRTVLVETFTGVWCPHCPAESIALHWIDENSSHNVIAISELHVCAFAPGQGPCLDNYVPPDGTSDARGTFYNVCGFPDVFFDGQHPACGATNYASQMYPQYESAIANASMFPGNVSISQVATIHGQNVTDHANVTSAVNGTFNAITYLVEYIGKQNLSNGGGPHDVDWVVRETLHNHPVTLVAGATTEVDSTGAITAGWNPLNFSVVTFVQANATKIIQNANMAPVTSMTASVSASQANVTSGKNVTISVTALNTTTGRPVAGAGVLFSSSVPATFSPVTGFTGADGSFATTFTAPNVSSPETVVISAQVSAVGYSLTTGTVGVLVDPIVPSIAPTGLTVTPGEQQVTLNWTVPAAGGAGVTYHIYRATAVSGTYGAIGTTTATTFNDTTVLPGQSYWYQVSANGATGFSANTSQAAATSITANTQGLPWSVGWWFSIDSANFTAPTNDSMPLFVPNGFFAYQFGPTSYAYLASGGEGTLTATGAALTVNVSFTPRYAALKGTVSPAGATVAVNGHPVAVVSGGFEELLAAGTYSVNVSAQGYQSASRSVTLTPGNVTKHDVALSAQSGTTTTSKGALSTMDLAAIGGAIAAAAVIIGVAFVLSARGKRGRRGGNVQYDEPASEEPARVEP